MSAYKHGDSGIPFEAEHDEQERLEQERVINEELAAQAVVTAKTLEGEAFFAGRRLPEYDPLEHDLGTAIDALAALVGNVRLPYPLRFDAILLKAALLDLFEKESK